ncbi:poly-gamma-glutamate hydrolase family protein [Consotaella aegiceratis]|uniref:poly-gamma-glutamate hydrolase family protein n=1 Tax=Consotaella aegiceratis TaxID=3097961 RepID=UPI002F41DED2
MVDRYRSFDDLANNARLGIDYRIRFADRSTACVIIAPHGGWIEPNTSEIAEAIAKTDLLFYTFEVLNNGAHSDFHISSHRFDEPNAIDIVGKCATAVAIHGRQDDGREAVWLGGRATALCDAIGNSPHAAGFEAKPNKKLPGHNRTNICNRTLSGEGVQLEIPRSLRRQLASDANFLRVFCQAVRNAILSSRRK